MDPTIQKHILAFQNLRTDHAHGDAPHKPILLLSLVELVKSGYYSDNKIRLTPELISTFKWTWKNLVRSKHHCNIALPFYHMKSEPFWELIPKPGFKKLLGIKLEMRSIKSLDQALNYALLEKSVYEAMLNPVHNESLRKALMDQYFPKVFEIPA